MFTPIGDLLKILPRRSKTSDAILALYVRREFQKALAAVCDDWPGEVKDKVQPVVFAHGKLVVRSPNLVAAELSMRSGSLMKTLNELLGKKIVTRISFRNY